MNNSFVRPRQAICEKHMLHVSISISLLQKLLMISYFSNLRTFRAYIATHISEHFKAYFASFLMNLYASARLLRHFLGHTLDTPMIWYNSSANCDLPVIYTREGMVLQRIAS